MKTNPVICLCCRESLSLNVAGVKELITLCRDMRKLEVQVCVCVCVEFINQVTFSCYALVHYLSILIAMLFVCLFQSIDCPLIVCLFVCFSPWYTFPRHFVFAIEVNL